jgi:outer membrane lipopolysaccharide assembly protein LptE/RlpB
MEAAMRKALTIFVLVVACGGLSACGRHHWRHFALADLQQPLRTAG